MDRLTELSSRYMDEIEERVGTRDLTAKDIRQLERETNRFWRKNATEIISEARNDSGLKAIYYGSQMPVQCLPYVRMTALYSHRILIEDPIYMAAPSATGLNLKTTNFLLRHTFRDLRSIRKYADEGIVVILPPLVSHEETLDRELQKTADKDFEHAMKSKDIDDLLSMPEFGMNGPDTMRFFGLMLGANAVGGRIISDNLRKIKTKGKSAKQREKDVNTLLTAAGIAYYCNTIGVGFFHAVNAALAESALLRGIPSTDALMYSKYMNAKVKQSGHAGQQGEEAKSVDRLIVEVLPYIDLWFLQNVPDEDILKIRSNTNEFHQLRENLRDVFMRLQDARPNSSDLKQMATEASAVISDDLKRLEESRKSARLLYGASAVQGAIAAASLYVGLSPIDILVASSSVLGSLLTSILGYRIDTKETRNNMLHLFWSKSKRKV